ncbi:S-phase kinase-associated protein 1 [Nematocida major]|uniref:S-phase kinase-associated protein 1 n=1 Tax=Nematocida major TaxID=1912982 RepID=UPI0020073D0E|nr:S-phase kinase-associated protein 1 [Nematocida major]KAH9385836.1 S-phase kinase-associated protein 1 [Nematocida major]
MAVRVETRDGKVYRLEKAQYEQSTLLRELVESVGSFERASILVESDVFERIISFMDAHSGESLEEVSGEVLLGDFDEEFLSVESALLFRITSAANYLCMPLLLEMCCQVISRSLREKSAEEIKAYLDVPSRSVGSDVNVQKEYRWIE